MEIEQAKAELIAAQADYIDTWNRALEQRKPDLVTAFVSQDFFGTFVGGQAQKPQVLDWQSYTGGLAQAVISLPAEARWRAEIHHIEMRGPAEGVLHYRSMLTGHGGGLELVQEVWRKEGDGWRILRCYEEVL